MEQENSDVENHNDEQLTTNQIKQKAQEIAKRFEKYQGRYHTTSSRCNTPLPITSADSIESIHSNSVISDTSEKLLLFRQFLENDRKLVENSKIDEQQYNNDGEAHNEKLLDVQLQNEKEQVNSTYYDDIIAAQLHEKTVNALKNQVIELNEKLENCHNIINEKDITLKSKIDKIESLNKSLVQKNKLHLETVEALKLRNNEIINEERLRFSQKINDLEDESDELKNNLEDVQRLCDKLKKNNTKVERENTELRKKEIIVQSEIENLNLSYENEKKLLVQQNHEYFEQIINGLEKELQKLQQENGSLMEHVTSLENKSDSQENNDLLSQLDFKESEIQRLNFDNENLNKELKNQITEIQQTKNRWIQLKDAYLNDKERMNLLDSVVEELKINNNELISTNEKLTEDMEEIMENSTVLKRENIAHQDRIKDLMAVIENMRETFEKAMKETSIEYELDKKQLLQQHNEDETLLKTYKDQLTENTLKLNEVTNQLDNVLKENDSYKSKQIELKNCLSTSNTQILELNNIISELNKQTSQMVDELESLKKENIQFIEKLKGTNCEVEENKLVSDRFHKQKLLLKVKIKALKESENQCSLLQQQVLSLTNELQLSNQNSEYLVQKNKQIDTAMQYCDMELQKCYELLNKTVIKSNSQEKTIFTLRSVLSSLTSLFSFDDSSVEFDADLMEIIDSISNSIHFDNELQMYLKKLILGSIYTLEYLMSLKNAHQLSKAQLIARTEVEKLVSEAVERVKQSTENEYQKQNNELLSIIENLQNDNHTLKLNTSNSTETKEILTDLNGPTVNNLLALENLDVKRIQNENDTLKQFLKHIQEKFGMINIGVTNDVNLLSYLSEIELFVQEIKNENVHLKNQQHEYQKHASVKTLEQPIEQQKTIANLKENDDLCEEQPQAEKFDSVSVNGDSKILLNRYKNLKSKFKEVRLRTADLDKKVVSLTNDLEYANSKLRQLNDQYASANENHETDMTNCQSEIENLMSEKLEAYRQLNALKEKHEILQNDYDQLKSNLDEKNSLNDSEINPTQINEQNTALKMKLNETQHLIDLAYSKVLCEWPPVDTDSDWIVVQSRKLEKIVNAKSTLSNNRNNEFDGFDLIESEVQRLQTCFQIVHELVTSILTNKCNLAASSINIIIDLMTDIKSCTETYLEFMSVKNNEPHLVNEHHIELPQDAINNSLFKVPSSSDKSTMVEPLVFTEQSTPLENEGIDNFQRAISERDRLIEFLSQKISKLDYMNRNVDDIKLIRDKLDRALTAVHERDIRCDELTLELTRLLEERDMLQLKLSNSIRQNQFLADNKPQLGTSNLSEEKYDSKNIDDKLEELHSLEYRRDADLFNDQEQRHVSQMQLHQSQQDSSTTPRAKSSNISEEASTTLSWFKDILW